MNIENLSYALPITKSKLPFARSPNPIPVVLLQNINFELARGDLCALMGPSGAGKSTLLDLIARRKKNGFRSGKINVSARESAYVRQDDCHIALLTVEESLLYAAWVKLGDGFELNIRKARVEMILESMKLLHVRNRVVGDAVNRGISGGELRRLSIGVEIVALPSLIYLDEPTSGLDSVIALEVMSAVRELCTADRICVATIHQPSREIFQLFNKLVLLSQGRMIYAGAAGESAVRYFTDNEQLPMRHDDWQNPAEFLLQVCSLDAQSAVPLTAQLLEQVFQSRIKLEFVKHLLQDQSPQKDGGDCILTQTHESHSMPVASIFVQLAMLFHRSALVASRNIADIKIRMFKSLVVGVLSGVVFMGKGHTQAPLYVQGVPTAQVINVDSILFLGLLATLLSNDRAIPGICANAQVYWRELSSASYSTCAYWLSQCIVELPVTIIAHYAFISVFYFLLDFPHTADYFFYYSFLLLQANIFTLYFALFLGAVCGAPEIAFAVFPMSTLVLSLFSGFPISISSLPPFWAPVLPWVAPSRWAFEGLMLNHWRHFQGTSISVSATAGGNGNDILQSYDFNDGKTRTDILWIMSLFVVAMMCVVYYFLLPSRSKLVVVTDVMALASPLASNMIPQVAIVVSGAAVSIDKQMTKSADDDVAVAKIHEVEEEEVEMVQRHVQQYQAVTCDEVTLDMDMDTTPAPSPVNWQSSSPLSVSPVSPTKVAVSRNHVAHLVFKNINYAVTLANKQTLHLLKEVTGSVAAGEMCAIMGSSGAGKSTLLDVLARRKTTGVLSGQTVCLDSSGSVMSQPSSAYVMQDNLHIGQFTVFETLQFAAELRLSTSMTAEEKTHRIRSIMRMLSLTEQAQSLVGDEAIRGISGGQLKRVSVAVEIVHLPGVIFLDEPTTGLDSAMAWEVMTAVRDITSDGCRVVLATIHQPSELIFKLFHKLILLSKGQVVYSGAVASAAHHFTVAPYNYSFDASNKNNNPADFVVSVAGGLSDCAGAVHTVDELAALYQQSATCNQQMATVNSFCLDLGHDNSVIATSNAMKHSEWPTSTWHQTVTLCRRAVLKDRRLPKHHIISVFRHLFVSILYGTMYYHLKGGTSIVVYTNRFAIFFFSLIFMIFSHQQSIPLLIKSRVMYKRESMSGLYGPLPYWVSLWFLQLPITAFNVVIFSAITYHLVGLNPEVSCFGSFFGTLYLATLCGHFMYQCVAAVSSTAQIGLTIMAVPQFFMVAFAGYIVFIPNLPYWLRVWAPACSPMRYAYQALVLNELQYNNQLPQAGKYLEHLGFLDHTRATCISVLLVFVFFYALLLLALLKFNHRANR